MDLRQQKGLRTKKRILHVALELFNKKGFSNVTVDEIIEQAETSKGAFYNHFKSKHDIFLEKFKEIDSFYVHELLPTLKPEASAKENLKKFFFQEMVYIEGFGWDVVRTIYENELNPDRESFFLLPDRPLYQILYNVCVTGQKNGEFREDISPEQMVTILARAIRGILYDWSINKGKYSLQVEQEAFFDVVVRGLLK
ncbi:TetR/AcrR family transcriptional regulator [Aneurinibacillus sp. BA2021]|nr:TetR/AcrR family transcriptional regulator [Aneurinibacillus sp. BA2021]